MKNLMLYIQLSILLNVSIIANPLTTHEINIYKAFISGDMSKWETTLKSMQKEYGATQDLQLLEKIIETQYGLIAYYIGNERKSEAALHLIEAEKNIDQLMAKQPQSSSGYVMKATMQAFRISFNKIKAPILGAQFEKNIQKALSINPNNAAAWYELGNMEFYKPMVFGGSKNNAVANYQKAVALFEKPGSRLQYNWVYLNALVSLAKAFENFKLHADALAVYEKILKIEPEFQWVKNELLPQLKTRL